MIAQYLGIPTTYFKILTVIENFLKSKYGVESILQFSKKTGAKKSWWTADVIPAVLLIWNKKKIEWHWIEYWKLNVWHSFENEVTIFFIFFDFF